VTADEATFELADCLYFMLAAVPRIKDDTGRLSNDQFLADRQAARQVRDAGVLNIGKPGEIAGDISSHFPEFAASNVDFPVDRLYRMRNQLYHGCHAINYAIVWATCRAGVPALERWRCAEIGTTVSTDGAAGREPQTGDSSGRGG